MNITAIDNYSRIMAPLFDEKNVIGVPTVFQTIFNSPMGNTIFSPSAEVLDIDIIRGNERIAKLRVRGRDADTIGTNQKDANVQRFTSIGRVYPLIEETGSLTASQFNKRVAGENPYENLTKQQRALILAGSMHREHMRKIIRKFEVLASQSFRTGEQNVSEDGTDKLDFYRNANLTAAVGGVWTNNANNPLDDMSAGVKALREIGHVNGRAGLCNQDTFLALINNSNVTDLADNRRLSFYSLGMDPGAMPAWGRPLVAAGAQYQGWIKVGAWTVYLFTYIDGYETDADPAVFTPYMPQDEFMIWDPMARYDRYFGPGEMTEDQIDEMVYRAIFGVSKSRGASAPPNTMNPGIVSANMFILGAEKNRSKGYSVLTQSAPIFAPIQTDSIYRITGTV